jgi:hypothetical protein
VTEKREKLKEKHCKTMLVGGFKHLETYEFVSWDDYSQYMESHKIHVPNHQPAWHSGAFSIQQDSPFENPTEHHLQAARNSQGMSVCFGPNKWDQSTLVGG